MLHKVRIAAPSKPPRIEFDSSVNAWYIRFRNTKVVKTISEERPGSVRAVDLDASNQVVGLELIGAKEFSIKRLKDQSPIDRGKVDFDRAVFVPAGGVS
jgi:hypothetical protein